MVHLPRLSQQIEFSSLLLILISFLQVNGSSSGAGGAGVVWVRGEITGD